MLCTIVQLLILFVKYIPDLFAVLAFKLCTFISKCFQRRQYFHHFPELPPELQMKIINYLDIPDRCKFAQCSKKCNQQAKESENYVYGLEFEFWPDFVITVRHEFSPNIRGYSLSFQQKLEKKFIRCGNLRSGQLWVTELDSSIDLAQYCIQYFQNLLHTYQNTIKKLSISMTHPQPESIHLHSGIKSFSNLEELRIVGNHDFSQFLSKTRRNLKVLNVNVYNMEFAENLKNCERIYQVQKLHFFGAEFNMEQFSRLSAAQVFTHIGQMTVNDVYALIRSWQTGTTEKGMKNYKWRVNRDFNVQDLFSQFGERIDGLTDKRIDIQHDREARKKARLLWWATYGCPSLSFQAN